MHASLVPSAPVPSEPLPLWMRRAQRGSDWGLLLAFVIGLCAAWGFITQPSLARTNDAEHAVFRADDYASAIAEGIWYPRWSPQVFGGYGAPVAHFSAPLPGLLPGAFQVLFAARPVDGVRFFFIAAFLLASVGTYTWAARWMDARGALITAFLYTLSPYVCLTIPHLLGSLPLMLAAGLLPCLWGALDRLTSANNAFDFMAVSSFTALLMLTHPASAVAALLIGGALALIHLPPRDGRAWLHGLARLTGASLLGITGAACFWLPALIDAPAVRWIESILPAPTLDIGQVFNPASTRIPGELRPPLTFTVGWAGWLAIGWTLWRWRKLPGAVRAVFLLAALIVLGAATLAPAAIWLMALALLCLALAAGSASTTLATERPLTGALMLLALITLSAPAWLSPVPPPDIGRYDAQAQIDYELSGFGSALVPSGEAIPTTLAEPITFDRALISSYQTHTLDRLRPAVRTQAQLGLIAQGSHFARYQVATVDLTPADLLISAFPGWTVRFNDTVLPLETAPDTGLLRFNLPAGRGELLIAFEATPVRTLAWWLTGASLALAAAISLRRSRKRRQQGDAPVQADTRYLSRQETRLIALVMAGWISAIGLFGLHGIGAVIGTQPGGTPLRARTDTGLEMIAFDGLHEQYHGGNTAEVTLFWQAQQRVETALQTRLFWLDLTTGARRGETDPHAPAYYSPQRWLLNRIVRDNYALPLNGLPAGDYALAIELLACEADCQTYQARAFFDADGSPLGQTLILPVRVQVLPLS